MTSIAAETSAITAELVDAELSIPARFARIAALYPHRPAVIDGSQVCTYAELGQLSARIAAGIFSRCSAADPCRPIALLLPHGASLVAAILGVLRSGRPYLVIDPHDAAARQRAVFHASGSPLLVTDHSLIDRARGVLSPGAILALSELGETGEGPSPQIAPSAAAAVTFTSGTTGTPRGVVQSHRMLLHHCRNYTDFARLCPMDRLTLLASCSVAASMSSLWGALLNGGALLPFDLRARGVASLVPWLHENKPTLLHCVPTVWRSVARSPAGPLDSLRLVRLGGETVTPLDVELFARTTATHCRLLLALSSTETGALAMHLLDHSAACPAGARVPLGRPLPGMAIDLVSDPADPAAPGRLRVRSRYLASGCWDASRQSPVIPFPADPAEPDVGVFQSADLARFNSDGLLEHLGRADGLLKLRGQRIDPAEVESALLGHPDLREAAVALPPGGESLLAAWFVPAKSPPPAEADLRAHLRPLLPDYMIPSRFFPVDSLPRTPSGKIDRRQLRVPAPREHERPRGSAPPRDSLERQLAVLFQLALGTAAPVHRSDDFFEDLGGTSLQAADVITRIDHRMGFRLPLSELVRLSTIEKLAGHLHQQVVPPAATPLVLLQEGESGRPPLFLFHRGSGGLYCYRQLVAHLAREQPVYGLQCPGLQGECWPFASMPALAAHYLQHIRRVQPQGPCLLAGTCLGGLLALESARQLRAAGADVALLALINAFPPLTGGSLRIRAQRAASPLKFRLRSAAWRVAWAIDRMHPFGLTAGPRYRQFVGRALSRARRSYRLAAYPGTLHFFAGDEYQLAPSRARIDRLLSHAADPRLHRFPGAGDDLIIPPAVSATASLLQSLIDDAAAPAAARPNKKAAE